VALNVEGIVDGGMAIPLSGYLSDRLHDDQCRDRGIEHGVIGEREACGRYVVCGSLMTPRWREMDSNSRSPVSGDTPERPLITSPAITSAKARLALRTEGFDPFAEILRAARARLQKSQSPGGSAMTLSLPANRRVGHVILGLDRLTSHAAQMDREPELRIIRRAFAKQVMAACGVGDPRVEAAFAAVAREDFLGPGPWQIVRWGGDHRTTPDPDPIYLYTDDVIGILPERNLNNGQPSLHAALIAAAAPQPGEHVVHIGAGVGYYTAILAELVGIAGRVTAIEFDAELAVRATANFAQTPP
jgi:hypothetical protein